MSKTAIDTRPLLLPDNPCIWDFKSDHAPREDRNPTRIMPPELKIFMPDDHPTVQGRMKKLAERKKGWRFSEITSRVWRDWEWEAMDARSAKLRFVSTYLDGEIEDICGTDIYYHADGELDLTTPRSEVVMEHDGKRYDCVITVYLSPYGVGGHPRYASLVTLKEEEEFLKTALDLSPRTIKLINPDDWQQDGGSVDLLWAYGEWAGVWKSQNV